MIAEIGCALLKSGGLYGRSVLKGSIERRLDHRAVSHPDLGSELLQQPTHSIVACGHDDRCAEFARMADGADQIRRVMAIVVHHRWA